MKRIVSCVVAVVMMFSGIGGFCGINTFAQTSDVLGIDFDCGDHTYFHSDYLNDKTNTYDNFTATPKGNTITCNRCVQRYNAQRIDNSIYLEKKNTSDVYFDIDLTEEEYPYFLISSNVKIHKTGARIYLAYIRDWYTSRKNVDASLLMVNESGVLYAGETYLGTAPSEFSFALGINLEQSKYDVYIDGVKKASNIALNTGIKKLFLARFWIFEGSATAAVSFDELEVTGMKKMYTGSDTDFSDIFPSDEKIIDYLSDKLALNAYSGYIFTDGKKEKLNKAPYYNEENGEWYVFSDTLKKAFGIELSDNEAVCSGDGYYFKAGEKNVTANNQSFLFDRAPQLYEGKVCIPLREFCERVLKLNYFDDKHGLIIISENAINLDLSSETPEYMGDDDRSGKWSDIESINRYMAFERPTKEEITALYKTNTEYPTLVADKTEFDAIRARYNTDAEYKSFCDVLIAKADSFLSSEPKEYNIPDGQRLSGVSSDLLEKMDCFGFAYQITKDEKYPRAAWKYLSKIGSYPDWNPSHMIDLGEICTAYAIGYSWMRDGFSDEERKYMYDSCKKLGMEPIRLAYYGRLSGGVQYADCSDIFAMWTSNFNAIINSGALCSALAFMEFDEEFCSDIVEKAVRSLEYTMVGFSPSGGWIEGAGYWDYMFVQLKYGISSVMSVLGTDFALTEYGGFDKTAAWRAGMWTYQGNNNFHDSADGRSYSSALAFLGKIFNEPSYYAMRQIQLTYTGNSVADACDAIWYSKDFEGYEDELPQKFSSKGIESFTVRSPYSEKGYTYLSAHGGPVSCYHSHADAGSFILDMNSWRWACDLGNEDYNVQRDGNEGFYSSYRRRAEAHNVIVINPNESSQDGGQTDGAFVPMISFDSGKDGTLAVYDMTQAYSPYVNDYKRSFFASPSLDGVTVFDRLSLKEQSEVNWFMTTKASVESCENNRIVLKQGNTRLYLEYETNALSSEISVIDCTPLLGKPVLEGQNPNSGYKRIRIKMTADSDTYISVSMSTNTEYKTKYGFNIPTCEYTFEEAVKNDASTITDNITKQSASIRHMPEILNYDVKNGVFGRENTDRSLYLWNSEEASDYSDPYQFVEYVMPEKKHLEMGESEEITFYMAFDGGRAGKYVESYVNAEGYPVKDKKANKKLFRLEPDGVLYIWNNKVEDFVPKKGRWYKFSIVNTCGNTSEGIDNTYRLYIDDKLVKSDSFVPDWRGVEKQSFKGFEKVWVGQQIPTGGKNENGGYYTSEMYLDELKIQRYGKGDFPFYIPQSFEHSNTSISRGIVGKNVIEFYIEKEKSINDIISGGITESNIVFTDSEGNVITDNSYSPQDLYMRLEMQGRNNVYIKLRTEQELCFEFDGAEGNNDKLPDSITASVSELADAGYVYGRYGRDASDSSLNIQCENNEASIEQYENTVQYTFDNELDNESPIYIEYSFSIAQNGENSSVDMAFTFEDCADTDKMCRFAKICSDGRILGSNENEIFTAKTNRWYLMGLCFYPKTMTADLYINGECVENNVDFSSQNNFKKPKKITFIQKVAQLEKVGFLLDDMKICKGVYQVGTAFSDINLSLTAGDALVDSEENVIYILKNCDISSQLSEESAVRTYKSSDMSEETHGYLCNKGVAALQYDNLFKYYDVVQGMGPVYNVKSFTASQIGNTVSIKYTIGCRKHNSPITLILARYNNDGMLLEQTIKEIKLYGSSAPSGVLQNERDFTRTVKFTDFPKQENTYLKVFLFTDMARLFPLHQPLWLR